MMILSERNSQKLIFNEAKGQVTNYGPLNFI